MKTKPKANRANKRVICLVGNDGKYFYAAYDSTKKFGWFVSANPESIVGFFTQSYWPSQPLPYYISKRIPQHMLVRNNH